MMKRNAFIYFVMLALVMLALRGRAQGTLGDEIFEQKSNYVPVIKDAAVKQNDQPEIRDTVKKIMDIKYSAPHIPFATSYTTSQIEPARMVNEPLSKLYRSLIKFGMGNYTMPYADIFLNSLRSKDLFWGVRYNHLSSNAKFKDMGRTDFADDNASIYAKKFYKAHTLYGDFNYSRNAVHYYGFSDKLFNVNADVYKQRFQLFEGKLRLQSHYNDTSKYLNHDVNLNYYNYGDFYNTYENNIYAAAVLSKNVDRTVYWFNPIIDYYNVHSKHDTVNNLIAKLGFYGSEGGKKWKADIGFIPVLDYFASTGAKFYPTYKLNIYYDVYQSMLIPFAGTNSDLLKNSFRSISQTNPFVLSDLNYKNTYNAYNFYAGLRGALSSNTSYETKFLYGRYNNMLYYLCDYNQYDGNTLGNRYKVLYMNTNYINVNAQVKYQYKEKMTFTAKGNYYHYQVTDTTGNYPWHKPDFDLTFSANYNVKSKLIFKADIFVIGKQWALQQSDVNGVTVQNAVRLAGITDINLGAEYRYNKVLSFFANFNNIGSYRYYRWDRYPTQRFNFMIGLTFVPF